MSGRYHEEIYKLKAGLCRTFADPKRLMIIDELRDNEKSVGDISASMGINQSLISRHLAVLRQSGVVEARRAGTTIYYSLSDKQICQTCDMMHQILVRQIEKTRKITEQIIT